MGLETMVRPASCCLLLVLAGCAGIPEDSHPLYGPVEPIDYSQLPQPENNGGLYTQGRYLSLFADVRAGQVGDIVSIVLVESTDASKSADTALDRASGIDIGNPTVFGKPASLRGGEYDLSVSAESESNFAGEAESSQSNSLQGSIAVQVSEVLPNGNLVVQGEKWIRINQGDEYIRLRGIIRPQDLSPTNTIPSTRVADARISYSGIGVANETNTPGWLTRFFMSPLMPF